MSLEDYQFQNHFHHNSCLHHFIHSQEIKPQNSKNVHICLTSISLDVIWRSLIPRPFPPHYLSVSLHLLRRDITRNFKKCSQTFDKYFIERHLKHLKGIKTQTFSYRFLVCITSFISKRLNPKTSNKISQNFDKNVIWLSLKIVNTQNFLHHISCLRSFIYSQEIKLQNLF